MDYKFLHKVIDQIVSETRLETEYGGNTVDDYRIYGPFLGENYNWLPYKWMVDPLEDDMDGFEDHCKDVYGLKDYLELEYVWDEWRKIIKDKIDG